MAEKTVKVDGRPVLVSEKATVAEVREKAGLPDKRPIYDAKSGKLLQENDPAPEEMGTIPHIGQG
jgi:hypothetical protein